MVSADIVTDYPFQRLHPPPQSLAHFVFSAGKTSHKGDFDLSPEGLLLAKSAFIPLVVLLVFILIFSRCYWNLRFAFNLSALPHPLSLESSIRVSKRYGTCQRNASPRHRPQGLALTSMGPVVKPRGFENLLEQERIPTASTAGYATL